MIPVWISLAGGLGAVSRFMSDSLVRTALGRNFPWGTLVINIIGSFILGILAGSILYGHTNPDVGLVIGTGFCGGFTTFSTASFEAARLIEEKRYLACVFQVFGQAALALLAAGAGLWLTAR